MEVITVKDREFELFLTQETIENAIESIARRINNDLEGKNPLFVCVLNGSFMFAAELMKRVNIAAEVSFVRMSSYSGTTTSSNVKEIYGLQENIEGRTVVIVEDIVDTGYTIERIVDRLNQDNPKQILVSTLLFKPQALKVKVKLDYVALEIPSDFIVGYGLDYDGYGRNNPNIYKIKD